MIFGQPAFFVFVSVDDEGCQYTATSRRRDRLVIEADHCEINGITMENSDGAGIAF